MREPLYLLKVNCLQNVPLGALGGEPHCTEPWLIVAGNDSAPSGPLLAPQVLPAAAGLSQETCTLLAA